MAPRDTVAAAVAARCREEAVVAMTSFAAAAPAPDAANGIESGRRRFPATATTAKDSDISG